MRIDPDVCRDPDLLAAEVRRLRAVIAAGVPTLTDEERAAIAWSALAFGNKAEELGRQDDLWVRLTAAESTIRNLLERMS